MDALRTLNINSSTTAPSLDEIRLALLRGEPEYKRLYEEEARVAQGGHAAMNVFMTSLDRVRKLSIDRDEVLLRHFGRILLQARAVEEENVRLKIAAEAAAAAPSGQANGTVSAAGALPPGSAYRAAALEAATSEQARVLLVTLARKLDIEAKRSQDLEAQLAGLRRQYQCALAQDATLRQQLNVALRDMHQLRTQMRNMEARREMDARAVGPEPLVVQQGVASAAAGGAGSGGGTAGDASTFAAELQRLQDQLTAKLDGSGPRVTDTSGVGAAAEGGGGGARQQEQRPPSRQDKAPTQGASYMQQQQRIAAPEPSASCPSRPGSLPSDEVLPPAIASLGEVVDLTAPDGSGVAEGGLGISRERPASDSGQGPSTAATDAAVDGRAEKLPGLSSYRAGAARSPPTDDGFAGTPAHKRQRSSSEDGVSLGKAVQPDNGKQLS